MSAEGAISEAVTNSVRVRVMPEFLSSESNPAKGLWLHAYHVIIANEGEETVQLMARHWVITNARGEVEHVRGEGVVGHQPVLRSGEFFRYSSGCPMNTPVGTMHGSYQMAYGNGEKFHAEIAPFTLAEPFAVN
jgi:ApaG protein